jgi:hypothetical protein
MLFPPKPQALLVKQEMAWKESVSRRPRVSVNIMIWMILVQIFVNSKKENPYYNFKTKLLEKKLSTNY